MCAPRGGLVGLSLPSRLPTAQSVVTDLSSGARASVEILDKELDDDETINSKLITKFHPIASLSPQLPSVRITFHFEAQYVPSFYPSSISYHTQPGEPMVAIKLADVDEHGQLSIQVVGPALSKLEELANQIEEKYSTGGEETAEVVVGGVYCAEYRLDHSWYRVKVLKEASPQKVRGTHSAIYI